MKKFIVAGLDLSSTATGMCSWNSVTGLHNASTFTRENKKSVWDEREMKRFCLGVKAFLEQEKPSLVALEAYGFGSMRIVPNAELGGIVRLLLHEMEMPFFTVAPLTLKKFVLSKGKVPKGQSKKLMLLGVYKKWNVEFADDDQADAYSLARMAACVMSPSQWKEQPPVQKDCFKSIHPSFECQRRMPVSLSRVMTRV